MDPGHFRGRERTLPAASSHSAISPQSNSDGGAGILMFATIYTPNFYLQAALHHRTESPSNPVALIETHERKAIVVQLNEAAEQAGVRIGMTPSQALARCLQVAIKTRSRLQEAVMQEILLHYAFTLSPFVEATAPGICTVQFTDHRELAEKVARVVEQLCQCEI